MSDFWDIQAWLVSAAIQSISLYGPLALSVAALLVMLGQYRERSATHNRDAQIMASARRLLSDEKPASLQSMVQVFRRMEKEIIALRRVSVSDRSMEVLAYCDGETDVQPGRLMAAEIHVVRRLVASFRNVQPADVRAFIPFGDIDRLLLSWGQAMAELLPGQSFPLHLLLEEAGDNLDRLLAADLALAQFPPSGLEARAAAGAVSETAAMLRRIMRQFGLQVDRPRLLCPVEESSHGFNATTVPGDRRGTWRMAEAIRIVADGVSLRADPANLVVAVAQFGIRDGDKILKTSILSIYNQNEWGHTP